MPVLRHCHKSNFTTYPNTLIQDTRLSLRDVGLLVWMLSKPQDWQFSYKSMMKELQHDGKGSIQSGVKNLQAAGYLSIAQGRMNGKLGETIWTVSDIPHPENRDTEAPYPKKPHPENQDVLQNNDYKKAVPAFECGEQPLPEFYIDNESGKWRRRENV